MIQRRDRIVSVNGRKVKVVNEIAGILKEKGGTGGITITFVRAANNSEKIGLLRRMRVSDGQKNNKKDGDNCNGEAQRERERVVSVPLPTLREPGYRPRLGLGLGSSYTFVFSKLPLGLRLNNSTLEVIGFSPEFTSPKQEANPILVRFLTLTLTLKNIYQGRRGSRVYLISLSICLLSPPPHHNLYLSLVSLETSWSL